MILLTRIYVLMMLAIVYVLILLSSVAVLVLITDNFCWCVGADLEHFGSGTYFQSFS